MTLKTPFDRRDSLPLWVWPLIILFLVLRVVDLWPASHHGRLAQQLAGQVDDKTMSATITTNWAAKTAFVVSFGRPGEAAPDPKALREALNAAQTLQKGTGNAPGAARRMIILRALLKQPIFGVGKGGPDPKAAFAPAALAGLPPEDIRRYASEGRLWNDVARGPHLTPAQTDAYAAELRATPNIKWWLSPGLAILYQSQGNPAAAQHYLGKARSQALVTMGPLGAMMLIWGVLGFGGLVLWFYLFIQRRQGQSSTPLPDPWPIMRETVPLEERRLRAGDLMGVFIVYLLMPDALGWLFGGVHIPHLLHFRGLIAPLRPRILALPAGSHVAVEVVVEFFAYLLSAAVPIGLLIGIARRRRASIGEELGWNTHRLGMNLLYGIGGYALALPLVLLAGAAGPQIFRHAPAPSNPAIPLLASAASPWVQALLVLLATVAAPLTEELLFRGVFYNAAKLRVGVWPAILLTGFVFGFVHPVGIAQMLPLAVLGGVFAWMAETRKSLAPSMLAHCFQNTFATLMLLLALGR